MNYRTDKYGNKLSALGFGCMRFQKKLGRIEFEKAEKLRPYEVCSNWPRKMQKKAPDGK